MESAMPVLICSAKSRTLVWITLSNYTAQLQLSKLRYMSLGEDHVFSSLANFTRTIHALHIVD